MTSKGSARGAAVRFGRPPKGLAGAVEERILAAASKVFLERGFEGASVEEIAEVARSGKPTIYARFPGKEALFTAVVMQSVAANTERFETLTPIGATIEERLESVAVAVLQWDSRQRFDRIDAGGDRGVAAVSGSGQQCLCDGARAGRARRGPAIG